MSERKKAMEEITYGSKHFPESHRIFGMQYPVIDKKRTSERIKFLMYRNCLKPVDIQKYLGLTCVQTVYRWLDGINIPSIDNLYALSQLFGVMVDDMLVGDRKLLSTRTSYKKCCHLLMYYYTLRKFA